MMQGTPWVRFVEWTTVAAIVAVIGACSAAEPPDNEGGGPLPQQFAGETYPGTRVELAGTVETESTGCVFFVDEGERLLMIWPQGSRSSGADVVLPGDVVVSNGAQIRGIGTSMPVDRLAGVPDGYWGNTLAFCAPDARRVAVFDSVVPTG